MDISLKKAVGFRMLAVMVVSVIQLAPYMTWERALVNVTTAIIGLGIQLYMHNIPAYMGLL